MCVLNTYTFITYTFISTHRTLPAGDLEAPLCCHTWIDSITLNMSYRTSILGFSSSRTSILCQAYVAMKSSFVLGEL